MPASKEQSPKKFTQSVEWLYAIIGGLLSALLFISGGMPGVLVSSTSIPDVLGLFAPLPIFAVGLSLSLIPALIACLGGLAVIYILSTAKILTLFYALLVALPCLILIAQSLRSRQGHWYPVSRLVTTLTVIGLGLAPVLHGIFLHVAIVRDGLKNMLQGMIEQLIAANLFVEELQELNLDAAYATFLTFYISFMVLDLLFVLALNGALAQTILKKIQRSLRPSDSLQDIRIPRPIWLAFCLALGVAVVFGLQQAFYFTMAAIILLFSFTFTGFSTIHRALKSNKDKTIWLLAFYLVFVILRPYTIFVTSVIGAISQIKAANQPNKAKK